MTTQTIAPKSVVRNIKTCGTCVNYQQGQCVFRLNSPDYFDTKVSRTDRSCDQYGMRATRIDSSPAPVFTSLDNMTEGVMAQGKAKGHTYRKIMDLSVISADALARLGVQGEHAPCIMAYAEHNGESVAFYLPNTKTVTVNTKLGRKRICTNRYDVVNLFKRVADKGSIDLRQWKRVRIES